MDELDCIFDILLDTKNQISQIQNDITDIQLVEKRKKECNWINLKNIIYKKIFNNCKCPSF